MKIIKNILSIFASGVMLAIQPGCTKYLDIKPYDKVVPETAEEFSALLHNHLNDIDEGDANYLVMNFSSAINFDACYADDFEICLSMTGAHLLQRYIGDCISAGNYNEYYSNCYECIRDCNIVLHEMKETGTEESGNVRAAAYAMRAVSYYNLLRYFCEIPHPGAFESQLGVPVVTKFDMEATPARSSMAQTVSQIEKDLLTALSYGQKDPIYRFTDDVCKGYLARLYFWCRRWDDCLTMCTELLEKYPLLDRQGFYDMMINQNKLGANQLIKCYRASSVSGATGVSNAITTLKKRPVSLRYLSNYPDGEKERDIRYSMSVNNKREACKPVFCGMRSAEFKLMEAEALYHLNRKPEALKAINDLRRNRISDYEDIEMEQLPVNNPMEYAVTDVEGRPITTLLGLILRERRKELFLENDRFWELKRNGAPKFETFYNGVKYTTLPYMYTMPIPIRENDIMGNVIQNPGYDEIVNKY